MPGVSARSLGWVAIGAAACGPSPPDAVVDRPTVTLEPAAPLDDAPSVLRVRVHGLTLPPASLALFEGELSDYYQGELANGRVPASLRARQVPAESWFDSTDDRAVLAPSRPLDRGGVYALGVLGSRPLATLHVDAGSASRYAARVWPPHEAARGGGRWVFCGEFGAGDAAAPVSFDPGGVAASAISGVDSRGTLEGACVRFEPKSNPGTGVGVPPPRYSGAALDPGAVDFAVEPPPEAARCADGEVPLGGACARVLDDRAIVRGDGALLLALGIDGRTELDAVLPGAPAVMTQLPVESRLTVTGTATDLAGREAAIDVQFVTGPPAPHVVLNEVLANPLGSEPAEEWVELVNDGTTSVDLGGATLEVSQGSLPLPPATLAPGEFALVVSRDYQTNDGRDVAAAPGTLVLRLSRLSLSNSGETLVLHSADGSVLSRFPALAPPRPGVSVARRAPWSLDGDPHSFGAHAGKGASPGWKNDIAAP